MYFGKTITIAAISALSLGSSVLATPIERGDKGYYPAPCNKGAVAVGILDGTQVCVTDINVASGNHVVITDLLTRRGDKGYYPAPCNKGGLAVGILDGTQVCVTDINVASGNNVVITDLL